MRNKKMLPTGIDQYIYPEVIYTQKQTLPDQPKSLQGNEVSRQH